MPDLSEHLSLLSEPIRVRLLAVLAREELDVGELVQITQLPQSTVSRHLKTLRVAGWVRRRAEGTSGLFRMVPDALSEQAVALWELVRNDFESGRQAAEDATRLQAVLDARRLDSRAFFGKVGARWEEVRRELFGEAFLLPTLLSLLPPGLEVADLGCGTGEAVEALAPACRAVIGVDQEQAMLDVAAERTAEHANVALHRADLAELPLPDATVDAVLCMLALHHVADPTAVLAEAARVLRPAGRLILLDMVAHEREEYRHTMGHRHLGFSERQLGEHAARAGLAVGSRRELPPAPDAQGPPLFLAVLRPR